MLRLERAIKQTAGHAPVVPNMWPVLADRQVQVRRGEVSVIAGPPGCGKSTLALALTVRSQSPALYVSADTHSYTMSLRLLAMLANRNQSDIEPVMLTHPEWCEQTLQQAAHIRWCFDSAPNLRSIDDELTAYEELYGDTPDLVVIDNLTDVVGDQGGDEWGGMRSLMKDFKHLARQHDTAVLVLHHTSEGYQLPEGFCPPMRALQGKVAQTPALVLTLAQGQPGVLLVCPVKSRYGPSAPGGGDPSWLGYNPASMQIYDPSEGQR